MVEHNGLEYVTLKCMDWSQVTEANPKSQSGDECHPGEVPNLSPQKILSVLFP